MILEIKNLSKFYPPNLWAVKNVDVSFDKGLIHAIIGENGAGKSTLMKICYGLISFDEGEIFYNGVLYKPQTPQDAVNKGIGMVHQEFMLFDELTVYENVVLGYEPTKFGFLDKNKMKDIVQEKNLQYSFNLNIEAEVRTLSVAAKQKVELLKLLFLESSVLIFDEPTSVLTPQECVEFFKYLSILRDNGKTIFYIGHKLEDILLISDTITILQKGILKAHYQDVKKNPVSKQQLIKDMIGTKELDLIQTDFVRDSKPILSLKNISIQGTEHISPLDNISLDLHEGEIIGVAAVEGHGQSELVQVIIGAMDPDSGQIYHNGKEITHKNLEERRKDIAFVSPNRTWFSSCQSASNLYNMIMGHHKSEKCISKFGFLDNKKISDFFEKLSKEYHVAINHKNSPISSLSGGNQQKLILAREYERNSNLILLEQPTRGLDVNSIQYIHNLILQKRQNKKATFVVSSDLDELFALCDRILVMYQGQIVGNIQKKDLNIEKIGQMMLTGTDL